MIKLRLIDADALVRVMCHHCTEYDSCTSQNGKCDDFDMIIIDHAPTIDAVPVVHGRWIDSMCRDWRCSECSEKINKVRNVDGYCYDDKPNYCPNCGARMDGDV